MTLGRLTLGDAFFIGITDDNLDHHVDENSQKIMGKHLSEVAAVMVDDAQEFQSWGTVYVCVPVGEVVQQGKLILATEFEAMMRAANAIGDSPLS